MHGLLAAAEFGLFFSIGLLSLYTIRHYGLALARLWVSPRHTVWDQRVQPAPPVTVMIPMHNEEKVAAGILQALIECDYEQDKLQILAIDDRSTDGTAAIIDAFAIRYPSVTALHRTAGNGGKPAALEFATSYATGEILLLFDADYVPGPDLLMQLVLPFQHPRVGAVMGRVVPYNIGESVLAGLLSLERAAGYQVAQEARQRLAFTPQFGGTVGGVRASALKDVGGWNVHSLTEDTDLTCRLALEDWQIVYVNTAECYEEVPHTWVERRKQLTRWVMGHTECFHHYWLAVVLSRNLTFYQKVDLLMLLGCYFTAPVMLLAALCSVILFVGATTAGFAALALTTYFAAFQAFANQATFVEIGVAAALDGPGSPILLLPLNLFHFFASTGAICSALVRFYFQHALDLGNGNWHKTARSRGNGSLENPDAGGQQIIRALLMRGTVVHDPE